MNTKTVLIQLYFVLSIAPAFGDGPTTELAKHFNQKTIEEFKGKIAKNDIQVRDLEWMGTISNTTIKVLEKDDDQDGYWNEGGWKKGDYPLLLTRLQELDPSFDWTKRSNGRIPTKTRMKMAELLPRIVEKVATDAKTIKTETNQLEAKITTLQGESEKNVETSLENLRKDPKFLMEFLSNGQLDKELEKLGATNKTTQLRLQMLEATLDKTVLGHYMQMKIESPGFCEKVIRPCASWGAANPEQIDSHFNREKDKHSQH